MKLFKTAIAATALIATTMAFGKIVDNVGYQYFTILPTLENYSANVQYYGAYDNGNVLFGLYQNTLTVFANNEVLLNVLGPIYYKMQPHQFDNDPTKNGLAGTVLLNVIHDILNQIYIQNKNIDKLHVIGKLAFGHIVYDISNSKEVFSFDFSRDANEKLIAKCPYDCSDLDILPLTKNFVKTKWFISQLKSSSQNN